MLNPVKLFFLAPYVLGVFPKVRLHLKEYKKIANVCKSEELNKQATLSIEKKDFHCLGGSVYAVGCKKILPFITSFQTISDYLDNLCDRTGIYNEEGFRLLHKAMIDSLSPTSFTPNYYELYPIQNDGGYLNQLVKISQDTIITLPSYCVVRQNCLKLTELYRDLQVYKHLDPKHRERKLIEWTNSHSSLAPNLYWWELAAATGSTLPTFALIKEASKKNLNQKQVKAVYESYFPWISGLHILLDYLIDEQEDQQEGDLNFVTYYETKNQLKQRLMLFIKNSLENTQRLQNKNFHQSVIKGLLAMYLSDPKVSQDKKLFNLSMDLIDYSGKETHIMYKICLKLRQKNKL